MSAAQIIDMGGAEEIPAPGPAQSLSVISAEIDIQIATARRYRRSVDLFMKQLRADVTVAEDVAQQCYYRLARKDKDGNATDIFGPSIRFAEIVLARWGNCRAAARIVDIGDRFVTAQGAFHDLETNAAVSKETQRRITTSGGKRYGDDMIGVTGNAAASIALRNAILAGVPQAYWRGAYIAALQTITGNVETFGAKRKRAIEWFAAQGVDAPRLFAALEVKGLEDIGADQILCLSGWKTAVEVEGHRLEDLIPPLEAKAKPGGRKADAPKPPAAKQNPDGAAPNSGGAPSAAASSGPSPSPQPTGGSSSAPSGDLFAFQSEEEARQWASDYRDMLEGAESAKAIRQLKAQFAAERDAFSKIDLDHATALEALAHELIEAMGDS